MTEMMKKFEAETGKQSAIVKFMAGGQALEMKSYPKLGPYDYNTDYITWLEAKANISDEAIKASQKIIRNQCDEITALKAQLTWRPVSEELPEKEKPVYPKPWRNRRYNPYIVTDGHEARFAFFAEVSKDKWWFVNPHNHHEIKNVVAWKDASLGLPILPAPEGE